MVPLCPVDGAPGDQEQEERHEAAMRAGGAAAPEHDGADVRDLEQQARERPVRVLRKRPEQRTAAQVQEHEISGHEPYRSWCRACVAGRGRADAHVGRPGGEKGVPIIGVDQASDAPHDEVAGEDPPDGVRTSSPVLCGRCSVDRWLFGHLCQAKGDHERNRAVFPFLSFFLFCFFFFFFISLPFFHFASFFFFFSLPFFFAASCAPKQPLSSETLAHVNFVFTIVFYCFLF